MKKYKNILFFLMFLSLSACQTLKPYQMIYINDPDMQMGSDPSKAYEEYVQSIRQGSTTPGGSKNSGGCGCN